jgi:hypothetical protein
VPPIAIECRDSLRFVETEPILAPDKCLPFQGDGAHPMRGMAIAALSSREGDVSRYAFLAELRSKMLNLRRLSAASALILCFSAAAHATATFDASAIATLTVTGIENQTSPGSLLALSVGGESQVLAEEALFDGNALASADSGAGVTGAPPLLRLDHLAAAAGTADAPGTAEAFALTDGFLSFENVSFTDTFLILLRLDYELNAAAAVGDVTTEDAFSSAFVDVLSESSTIDFSSQVLADALLGPPLDADGGQLEFQLLVGPGESDTVFLSTFASGFAEAVPAAVPEASTVSLLFAAFLALGWRRRTHS